MQSRPRPRSEAPPRLDLYVGMLAAALGSLVIGCVLLCVDYSNYPKSKPDEPAPPEPIKIIHQSKPSGSEKG